MIDRGCCVFLILAAYYRGAHVIMGVFDLSNLETLVSAERWIKEALEITAADNPIVFLIGSKQDLIVKIILFFLRWINVFFFDLISLMKKHSIILNKSFEVLRNVSMLNIGLFHLSQVDYQYYRNNRSISVNFRLSSARIFPTSRLCFLSNFNQTATKSSG